MTTRVLHLIKGLGPGGAEQLLVNQAKATSDDDLEFTDATPEAAGDAIVSAIENPNPDDDPDSAEVTLDEEILRGA